MPKQQVKIKKLIIDYKIVSLGMATSIQYIIDNDGHKKSVIVPFKQWEEMNQRYQKLNNKVQILTGITEAMKEVKQSRKSGKKLQTLRNFLDESRD